MEERVTPEEKLLKIIENPTLARRRRLSFSKIKSASTHRLKLWRKSLGKKESFLKLFRLKNFNRVLIGFCSFFTFFLIFDFYRQRNLLEKRFLSIEEEEKKVKLEEKEDFPFQFDLLDMFKEAKRRSVFSFVPPKKEEPQVKKDLRKQTREIVNNFKLVGIIWSQEKPQVMIEDIQQNRTLLLGKGEKGRFNEDKRNLYG